MAAHLMVYEIDGGIEWCISNLQSPFNDGYSEVGISWTPINDGSTTSPNIAARVYPTSSDSSHSSPLKQLLLEPGEYTFYGYALVGGKYWQTDGGSGVRVTVTGGSEPDIDVSFSCSSTYNSITVTVYTDSDAPYYKILCRLADNSGYEETIPYSGFDYHSCRYSETFTGLGPSTEYAVNVQYSPSGEPNSGTWVGKQLVWTEEEDTPTVNRWNWYGTNETSISDHRNPASSTETQLAYSALTSKGPVSDFNHRVWNDMCFKCREVLAAKGFGREGLNGWRDYNGLDFEDTLMHTGNTEMTADRFNALRYNIGSRIVVDWEFDWSIDIQPGKPIKGSYFIDLARKLNQFVDSI